MFEKNQMRMEEARKEQDDLIATIEAKAFQIHSTLRLNENGEATREEVTDQAMPLVAKLFESALIEYNAHNLNDLVNLMDTDASGLINQDEFTHCIVSYATGIKPLSIQEVHYNVCCCLNKIDKIQDMLDNLTMTMPTLPASSSGGANGARIGRADDVVGQKTQDEDLQGSIREWMQKSVSTQLATEVTLQRGLVELRTHMQEQMAAIMEVARHVVLPGGYLVGERVLSRIDFSAEPGHISRNDIGVVKGYGTGGDRRRINVDFPHLRSVNMLPSQVRRETSNLDHSLLAPLGTQEDTKSTTVETPGSPERQTDAVHTEQRWRVHKPACDDDHPVHLHHRTHPWSGPGHRAVVCMSHQTSPAAQVLKDVRDFHVPHLNMG
eukprot:SRR837773.5227.p1 GENE.SRR837773.5227~~SRR837773.5227.p1  ORF type:complete len:442 (+),score=96.32 SRR837773.5227:188-1327(+)